METIKKDYGEIILHEGRLFSIDGSGTGEGWVFKDYEAFKTGVGPCYVSEYGLGDIQEELVDLEARYENGDMTDEEYRDKRERIILAGSETRQTIIDQVREAFADDYLLSEEQIAVIAEDAFNLADWAYISTYLAENESIDEIILENRGGLFTDFQVEAIEHDMTPHEYLLKQ